MTHKFTGRPSFNPFARPVNRRPLALAISSLLIGGALAGSASAQAFPAVVKLSDLDGQSGFRIDGVTAGDQAGWFVSLAGDINGDGIDDLIIGAKRADPDGNIQAGSSYVVFGRDVSVAGDFPATLDLSTLDGSNGFRLDGVAAGDYSGVTVSSAGDINGDGIDDLVIAASNASPGGINSAGSSYVVFGRDVSAVGNFPAVVKLADLDGSDGFRIDGVAAFDQAGYSASFAGDINGDGIDDLILGAQFADSNVPSTGSGFVVFGRDVSVVGDFPATLNLSDLDGSNGFRMDGVATGDRTGRSVSAAGDINGDGIDDLIIGALRADPDGISDAGSTYVVFGRDVSAVGEFPATLSLSSLDGGNGFRLAGVELEELSGAVVSAAGDINGDGIDDVIISALGADPDGNTNAGSSYVVFGRDVSAVGDFPATLYLSSLDGSTGFRLDGVAPGDSSGDSVSAADVNGDGIDDLIIGAGGASPDGIHSAGSTYVVFGRDVSAAGEFPATMNLSTLDGTNGFRIDGVANSDNAGYSVSGAGDINGDGVDDVIIGAFLASPGGITEAGSIYVVFGSDTLFADGFESQ